MDIALAYMGAGIGFGLTVIGAGIGIGRLAAAIAEGVARQPSASGADHRRGVPAALPARRRRDSRGSVRSAHRSPQGVSAARTGRLGMKGHTHE